ncbi:FRG domain-containing protein [Alienimonas californiensis]|uniref:FRG domain protein n=1 Tax=Alienimonas californiensis TaxID=2527989 RepID=A0A517P774_9PLAN|nr:FRG domain-containing protein [Alienimonas californiensis]QDT15228.1 FRG domain protein [Alienimonas californiensis]
MSQKLVQESQTETVEQFVRLISGLERRHVAQWFFRGHSEQEFRLVPSLFRVAEHNPMSDIGSIESYLMGCFKREAPAYLKSPPPLDDELGWLTIAQHHGVPTRLLDWSTNPLVALYFAVEQSPDQDGNVWCLGAHSTHNCLPASTHTDQRSTVRNSGLIVFPRHLSPRVTNQSGCFTNHRTNKPADEADWDDYCRFTKITIPAGKKKQVLSELFDLGIHGAFIWPDLGGLADRLRYEVTVQHDRRTECDASL